MENRQSSDELQNEQASPVLADDSFFDNPPDAPAPLERHRRARRAAPAALASFTRALLFCAGAVVLFFAAVTVALLLTTAPRRVALFSTPSFGPAAHDPFLSQFCSFAEGEENLHTSHRGSYEVDVLLFGFIPRVLQIEVCDLNPPVFTVGRVCVARGSELKALDLVRSYSDETDVVFSFVDPAPDTGTVGDYPVTVLATDAGGNTARAETTVTVTDDPLRIETEFGTDTAAVRTMLNDACPGLTHINMGDFSDRTPGTFSVYVFKDELLYLYTVVLQDRTPPTASARPRCYLQGDTPAPADFLEDLYDASAVTLSFETAPCADISGDQSITVIAVDAAGNRAAFHTTAFFYNLPGRIDMECGLSAAAILSLWAKDNPGAETPVFPEGFNVYTIKAGTSAVTLDGKYGTVSLTVHAVDTTPPVLGVQAVTTYVGHAPNPMQFVFSCYDSSAYSVSVLSDMPVDKTGAFTCTVAATDAFGNRSVAQAMLYVIADTTPPAFTGLHNFTVSLGETVSFRDGVSVYDNADGALAFTVDASAVNFNKIGDYRVLYRATDSAGNLAEYGVTVTVLAVRDADVYALADRILSEILYDRSSERMIAYQIFEWCAADLSYSTQSTALTGDYLTAAYAALKNRCGNCYGYFAVSDLLLTRAGLSTVGVHRNTPDDPHYWSLVRVDGSWYHFDVCPHPSGYPLTCFLLTDAQVAEYSETQIKYYYSTDPDAGYPKTP